MRYKPQHAASGGVSESGGGYVPQRASGPPPSASPTVSEKRQKRPAFSNGVISTIRLSAFILFGCVVTIFVAAYLYITVGPRAYVENVGLITRGVQGPLNGIPTGASILIWDRPEVGAFDRLITPVVSDYSLVRVSGNSTVVDGYSVECLSGVCAVEGYSRLDIPFSQILASPPRDG